MNEFESIQTTVYKNVKEAVDEKFKEVYGDKTVNTNYMVKLQLKTAQSIRNTTQSIVRSTSRKIFPDILWGMNTGNVSLWDLKIQSYNLWGISVVKELRDVFYVDEV